ncbi:MAG: amidohydrolase family protein, partial [Parabacteroides sp.]|nr:amidohydrolase family protein [Parabacteroides sp.]
MSKQLIADIIFYNGSIISVDRENNIFSALAVCDNMIIYIGNNIEVKRYKGINTKLIDLRGRSLVPGFIDSHLHMAVMGANALAIDCRSPNVNSIEDIKRLVKERAEVTPKGQWIRGWGYDHTKLVERRHPTKWDLDEVAPNHPVMLTRVCAHISTHNTKSLELAGITDDRTTDISEGIYIKENGHITGVVMENAHMHAMKVAALRYEEISEALVIAGNLLIKEGITSVHDSGGYGFVQMRAFQDTIQSNN